MPTYHDAESLARALGSARRSGLGWECICPSHDDTNPSLWVIDGEPGRPPKLHCRAKCGWEAVQAAVQSRGLSWDGRGRGDKRESPRAKADRRKKARWGAAISEILTPVPDDAPSPTTVEIDGQSPTHIYEYRDERRRLLRFVGRVDRTDGKVIRPFLYARLADGRNCWILSGPDHPSTLYGLHDLCARPTAPVLIVEGEKAVDAAATRFPSYVVVTWQGGAKTVESADWSPLAGREVTIWPDADEAGSAAAAAVAQCLVSIGVGSVRSVSTAGLPPKWDLADTPPEGLDIAAMLKNAHGVEATATEQEADQRDRALVDFVITADELVRMDLPQREYLITPFLSTNSLNMIYAQRGLGKTWFCLSLALSLAKGDDFLDYFVERLCHVLYIDGEMPLADLQARVRALDPGPPASLMLLPSEILYREAKPLNLHSREDQGAIEGAVEALVERAMGPAVVILDNLSSLSGGIDENDNSALDALLQWLMGLRHQGLAIILVHHAGKSGTQRGASRREDLLDTSIALLPPDKDDEPHPGAHFTLTFPKTRGLPPDPREMELMLTEHRGQLQWQFSEKRKIDPSLEFLRLIWDRKPAMQKELAKEKGLTDGRISQLCGKLRRKKLLEPSPSLQVTPEGKEALIAVFPELEAVMLSQGELAFRDVV